MAQLVETDGPRSGAKLDEETFSCTSPEFRKGRRSVDTRSDVYSIGVLMYLLLTGEVPLRYEGLSLTEMHHQAANVVPPPASRLLPTAAMSICSQRRGIPCA